MPCHASFTCFKCCHSNKASSAPMPRLGINKHHLIQKASSARGGGGGFGAVIPQWKTGMGTNALKSAVEVSSRVRTREGAAKVNKWNLQRSSMKLCLIYCEGKKLQWKSEMELIEDRLYLRKEMKWDLQCYRHENECTYCWGENSMKILDGSTISWL